MADVDVPVEHPAVRLDAVDERVAPLLELLLHVLAQVDDGEAAAVAQQVEVRRGLGALERVVDARRERRVLAVELAAQHHHVHGREDALVPPEPEVFLHVIGEEAADAGVAGDPPEQLGVRDVAEEGVDLAVEQALEVVLHAHLAVLYRLHDRRLVVDGEVVLGVGDEPAEGGGVDAVAVLEQPPAPRDDGGAERPSGDALALQVLRAADAAVVADDHVPVRALALHEDGQAGDVPALVYGGEPVAHVEVAQAEVAGLHPGVARRCGPQLLYRHEIDALYLHAPLHQGTHDLVRHRGVADGYLQFHLLSGGHGAFSFLRIGRRKGTSAPRSGQGARHWTEGLHLGEMSRRSRGGRYGKDRKSRPRGPARY